MCYAATHPEKMDAQKQVQWQKLAKLQPADMNTIINLEALGVPVRKRGKASGLSFGRKRKRAVRKVCACECLQSSPAGPSLPARLSSARMPVLLSSHHTLVFGLEPPTCQRACCCTSAVPGRCSGCGWRCLGGDGNGAAGLEARRAESRAKA